MKLRELIREFASLNATSAANVNANVVNAPTEIGKNRTNKKYTGSPGKSGTEVVQTKTVQPKNSDGTAVNALNMKGKKGNLFGTPVGEGNLFTGGTIKRS